MNSYDTEEKRKKKYKKPFWMVRWNRLRSDAPKNMSRSGSWVYMDRKVALRDIAYYDQFYENITGPDAYFENTSKRVDWSSLRR